MAIFLGFTIIYVSYGVYFLTTFFRSVRAGVRGALDRFSEAMMTFTEVIFTVIGPIIGFMRFDEYGPEIPFSKQHVLTVILFVTVSSLSFWIARFTNKTASPVLRILVSVGLLQGIILCLITSIHFISFIPLGVIYPFMGFELLSPVFAFFLLLRELDFYNKIQIDFEDALPYRNELGFVPLPIKILEAPAFTRLLIYGGLMVVLIVLQMIFAYGCGQEIDSIVKAYTHSVGFVFSR